MCDDNLGDTEVAKYNKLLYNSHFISCLLFMVYAGLPVNLTLSNGVLRAFDLNLFLSTVHSSFALNIVRLAMFPLLISTCGSFNIFRGLVDNKLMILLMLNLCLWCSSVIIAPIVVSNPMTPFGAFSNSTSHSSVECGA